MSRRTVYLSYVFPPDEAPRAIQVERLVRHSTLSDLHVVCATQTATGENVHPVPWGRWARTRRTARTMLIGSRRLLIPDQFRPWARDAARAVCQLRPDTLVTFGQPMSDHLAGLWIKRRAGVSWLAHFSDPWTDNPFRDQSPAVRAANRRWETAVFEAADTLLFTSTETIDLVMSGERRHLRAKTHVVPHAIEREAYPAVPPRAGGARVVMRHLGAFYGRRRPDPLLLALQRLLRDSPAELADVAVELWGTWDTPMGDPAESAGLPTGLVSVEGEAPYAKSLELMRTADLLVLIDAPAERSVFLPSKLVDYLGARRPLLALTPPGTAASVVTKVGGWVASPDDPDACVAALRTAVGAARANARRDWGDPAVVARYEAPQVARRMDQLVRLAGEG